MGNLTKIKADLFRAREDLILAHAVNSKGVMGSGIAAIFKKKFPANYLFYKECCEKENMTGKCILGISSTNIVANLVTSEDFGMKVDEKDVVLKNTESALEDMFTQLEKMYLPRKIICSNKFNSGLFGVPWEYTEAIVEKVLSKYPDYKWIIFEID